MNVLYKFLLQRLILNPVPYPVPQQIAVRLRGLRPLELQHLGISGQNSGNRSDSRGVSDAKDTKKEERRERTLR